MKTKTILTLLLVAVTISAQAQQKKVVEQPPAMFANNTAVEINKVTLSDTETVLDVNAYFRPGYWIRIVSDTYLLADGKKYMVRTGEGITLDSLFWMPQSGEAEFKLTFEPLPKNTQSFDFIESDCEDCFKIYGIDLINKQPTLLSIPQEYTQKYAHDKAFNVSLQKGDAVVSGQLLGYRPVLGDLNLIYYNPMTGSESKFPVKVNADGTFTGTATVYSPTQLLLQSKVVTAPIMVAPGKESKILINLPEIYRANSKLRKDEEPYSKKYYYAGYLANLNTDFTYGGLSFDMQKDFTDSVAGMDIHQLKEYMMNAYHKSVAHNNSLDVDPLLKWIANANAVFYLDNNLAMADYILMQNYAKENNMSYEEASKSYVPAKKPENFNDYYRLIPYDDEKLLLVPGAGYMIRNLRYSRGSNADPLDMVRHLAENEKVSVEDRVIIQKYITAQENKEEFKEGEAIASVFQKYKKLIDEYLKYYMGEGYLARVWGTNDAFLLNMLRAQTINSELENFNPLTQEQKTDIATLPPFIEEFILSENENLLKKIEENKKKTGFTVLNPPTNADEQLFVKMLKPFAGKVILVDVWATWCGPCRAANKEMEPLKAQFADKDVVFLYLAGEDSPENTWKNMIPDMKGQHYRVNQAQWDYLRNSLNARGVPTYVIIDREGNHSFHSVGFPGVDAMRNELNKALSKK